MTSACCSRTDRRLPVDVVPVVATTDLGTAIGNGLGSIGGDLPVDGSIGARTAWMHEPYADGSTGVGYFADDELAEFFHGGHGAGLQVGVHAIGDRAIDQVLAAWERVYHALDSRERRHFRARRHRVEHFEVVSPSQIERAAMLGLAASVQPAFDATWGGHGGLYEQRLGARARGGHEPVPDDGGPWRRGRRRIRRTDHRARPDARDRCPRTTITTRPSDSRGARRSGCTPSDRLGSATRRPRRACSPPGCTQTLAAFDADPFATASLEGLRPVLTVSLGREVFAA